MDADRARVRLIAMMNQKGGVGKTTTAVNLGAALAEAGANVLLIDLDPQAHLSLHVGLDPNDLDATVYDLLTDADQPVEPLIQSVGDRLSVIASEVNLAGAEAELVHTANPQGVLRARLGEAVRRYDYAIIDCPPSLGLLTMNALSLAEQVIVPMQAHFLALQGLSKLLETVQLVRQKINPNLRVAGVVLCMHDRHTNLATEVVADLEQFFAASRPLQMPWSNAKLYQPPVRRNIKLAECPSFGQTIFQYEPWCGGARDYLALAEAILAEDNRTRNNGPPLEDRPAVAQAGPEPGEGPGSAPPIAESPSPGA